MKSFYSYVQKRPWLRMIHDTGLQIIIHSAIHDIYPRTTASEQILVLTHHRKCSRLQSYRHLLEFINLFPHAMDFFFFFLRNRLNKLLWFVNMTYRHKGCWTVTCLYHPLNSLKLLGTQLSFTALCTKPDSVLNFLRIENVSYPRWCLPMPLARSLICKTAQ